MPEIEIDFDCRKTCPSCGGTGKYVGLVTVEDPCEECAGEGEILSWDGVSVSEDLIGTPLEDLAEAAEYVRRELMKGMGIPKSALEGKNGKAGTLSRDEILRSSFYPRRKRNGDST